MVQEVIKETLTATRIITAMASVIVTLASYITYQHYEQIGFLEKRIEVLTQDNSKMKDRIDEIMELCKIKN